MTRFDRIAVVDWSASSAPPKKSPQADAIWIGQANARGVVTTYHSSRHMAEQAIVAAGGSVTILPLPHKVRPAAKGNQFTNR